MILNKKARWRCERCDEISLGEELLVAPNPFDPMDRVMGCPHCEACFGEDVHHVCDEPDCKLDVSCGWPTGDNNDKWGGYRQTCGEHCAKGKK